MRILWLSHLVPYPPNSGVAQRSFGLLDVLMKRHDVTLLALHQPELMRIMSADPEAALAEARRNLANRCRLFSVCAIPAEHSWLGRQRVAAASLISGGSYTVDWFRSSEFSRTIDSVAKNGFDVVHFDTIGLGQYRRLLGSVPCVMNHHNIESHMLLRRAEKSSGLLRKRYYELEGRRVARYERAVAGQYASHLVCSELDGQRLQGVCPGLRYDVIPNGVDTTFFAGSASRAPEPKFIFAGTLGWGANREAAESIVRDYWPALSRQWPESRFTLIGSDPPSSSVNLAAHDRRFVVTGYVDDIRPYFSDACFFICPIRDGGGTKLKVLNAMAMGTVVVSHSIALEGIEAVAGVDVFSADDVAECVKVVERMIDDPPLYESARQRARALIEQRYSYESIASALESVYVRVIESAGAGQDK